MEFNEVIDRRRTSRDCPYVIVPLFKCARLNADWVSKLNKEHNIVLDKLGVPNGWMTPCFIGIGYPKEDELALEQYDTKPDKQIHMGAW